MNFQQFFEPSIVCYVDNFKLTKIFTFLIIRDQQQKKIFKYWEIRCPDCRKISIKVVHPPIFHISLSDKIYV